MLNPPTRHRLNRGVVGVAGGHVPIRPEESTPGLETMTVQHRRRQRGMTDRQTDTRYVHYMFIIIVIIIM